MLTLMPSESAVSMAPIPSSVPVDQLPQLARLVERALRVVGQKRRDLDRHQPVVPVRRVVDGAEDVAGVLDVLDRDLLERRARLGAPGGEGLHRVVVVVALADGLLEDRGVGGDAAQVVPADHPLQLAVLDDAAADVVQPHALSLLVQGVEAGGSVVGHR
jgi:hypothetical protein